MALFRPTLITMERVRASSVVDFSTVEPDDRRARIEDTNTQEDNIRVSKASPIRF